jgi:hypothetical protein
VLGARVHCRTGGGGALVYYTLTAQHNDADSHTKMDCSTLATTFTTISGALLNLPLYTNEDPGHRSGARPRMESSEGG